MAHIVFAAPRIDRFPLHERLRRELLRREHRVTVLCCERTDGTFWRAQFDGVETLPNRRPANVEVAATQWLERHRPDLLLFHARRSKKTLALERAGRATGCDVLWTGDGLLPHTMQVDEQGLDGAASSGALRPRDLRAVTPDDELLDASLAHALSGNRPLALPSADVRVPPPPRRLVDALAYAAAGRLDRVHGALSAWQGALPPSESSRETPPTFDLQPPFVAVLLQHPRDHRLRLDSTEAPTPGEWIDAALPAAEQLAPNAQVAVVQPPERRADGRVAAALRRRGGGRVHVLPHDAAALAAATAASIVTVNHPAATAGLLAGTPVLHTGRALYELEGVTHRITTRTLLEDHHRALAKPRPALRRRFLTWLLRYGHLWCSTTAPSFNGMLGLVDRIEQHAPTSPAPRRGNYRAGPAWPLGAPESASTLTR